MLETTALLLVSQLLLVWVTALGGVPSMDVVLEKSPTFKSALIIEPDRNLLKNLRSDREFSKHSIELISETENLEARLQNSVTRYSAVFLSDSVAHPSLLPMIKIIHQIFPATPLYVTYETLAPFSEHEMRRLGLHGLLPKPVSVQNIKPYLGNFVSGRNFSKPVILVPYTNAEDRIFRAVQIEEFLSGTNCLYDIFLRLPQGRYLKIQNAKSALDISRVKKFRRLGVGLLYLKRESHERCLRYCDLLSAHLISHQSVSLKLKYFHLAARGRELSDRLANAHVGESEIDFAIILIDQAFALIRLHAGEAGRLANFLFQHSASFDHLFNVTFVACLLATPLEMTSPPLLLRLGLAAIFHDIALANKAHTLRSENENLMSKEELVEYQKHPIEGSKLLTGIYPFDEITLQAIAQHHERRDNQGFPLRTAAGEISPLGEIIGLSDEFVRIIDRFRGKSRFEIAEEVETKLAAGFSLRVMGALRAVFFPDN